MTKDEAKHKLRKEGYNVVDDNSVVTVLIPVDASVPKTVKEIEEKLKTYGYESSFAVKQVTDSKAIESQSVGDDEDNLSSDEAAEEATIVSEDVTASADAADASDDDVNSDDQATENIEDKEDNGGEIEYFDEDDSDMLLTEEAVQFSLDDFGLDY